MAALRSLIRILLASAVALAILSIASYHGLRWYGAHQLTEATTSFIEHHGSIDPSSYVKPEIPDNQNAAFWFLKGGTSFQWKNNDGHDIARAAVIPFADWGPEVASAVQAAEARNPQALAFFGFAAVLPESNFSIDYSRGVGTSTPSILRVMRGARLSLALARRDLAHGDFSAAEKNLQCMKKLSESLESEIDINTQYSGWAVESMLLNIIREQLEAGGSRSGALTTLKSHIPTANLTAAYETYLCWRVASRMSHDHRFNVSTHHISSPRRFLSRRSRQRIVHSMLRDIQAARQLKALHQELAEYSSFSCGQSRENEVIFDDPVFSNLFRFVNWFEAVRISRHITATAIDLTNHTDDDGFGQSTSEHGETISWLTGADGTIVVTSDRSDTLAKALNARRYNPPPPLEIHVTR